MNSDKVLSRFAAASTDEAELRRLARSIGNELPRQRLDVLRSVRTGLASAPICDTGDSVDSKSYAKGYVASMLDVIAEYETIVAQQKDAAVIAEMVSHMGWGDVLRTLREGPRRSAELAMMLGHHHDRIVQVLSELCVAGLAQTSSTDSFQTIDSRARHARPYRLTVAGQRVADTVASELTDGVARGIRVAVALFQHLLANASGSADVLEAIAEELLHDPQIAADAVNLWAEEARDAGLISERDAREAVRESDSIPAPIFAAGSEAVAVPVLEQRAALATMTPRDLVEQHIHPDVAFHVQEHTHQPGSAAIPLYAANDNGGLATRIECDDTHDDEPNSPSTI